MATQIQLRRDTEGDWNDANPVLAEGEVGLILDADEKIVGAKVGNGASAWVALETHLPLLSGVANALEDAGGVTESGVPVNNVEGNHTFLLKGLASQNSKVLGVADSDGTVKFSVDKDGNVISAGTTTLTGGVSGDINLLTGALQVAGNTSMQIMQIVNGVQADGSSTYYKSGAVDATVGWVLGASVTITPKSTSSKIIIVGDIRLTSSYLTGGGNSEYIAGHTAALVVGNTNAYSTVHNGTIVPYTWKQSIMGVSTGAVEVDAWLYKNTTWFKVLSPSTTSELCYDIVFGSQYDGSGKHITYAYPEEAASDLYAIEIL